MFGLFRTPSSPDEFVWLRGFSSLEARFEALSAFYTGPVWRRFRDEANATMVDSDNVLLLRPVVRGLASPPPGSGVHLSFGVAPSAFAVFETEPGPNNFPQLPVRTDGPFTVSFSRSASPGSESLEATSRSLLR
ncbi:NIPSNAP family protein [Amycolatopsis sp. NPDC049691]|uniref:NIPSNAP family protein n=1 Tax=Amycolatopsis sp. NPDC049691 TaxID=3155155 RepID=UPI003418C1A1